MHILQENGNFADSTNGMLSPFLIMVKASALSSFGIHLESMTNRAGLSGPETTPIRDSATDIKATPTFAAAGTAQSRTPMPNKLPVRVLWPPMA